MTSEFPQLQKKLDEIRIRIDQVLKDEFIKNGLIEEVELELKPEFFISRSFQADAVLELQQILVKVFTTDFNNSRTIDVGKIQKQHIYAAQSLLQMSRCEKLAIEVLIAGLSSTDPDVPDLASKALGKVNKHLNHDKDKAFKGFDRPGTPAECAVLGKPKGCWIST
jgi:hypothetical protein